jgi:hypothetical protein
VVRTLGPQALQRLDNRLFRSQTRLIQLNAETVLEAVANLRARTGRRVFTLFEVAEAMWPAPATVTPGTQGPAPWPHYVTVIDRLLQKLGNRASYRSA